MNNSMRGTNYTITPISDASDANTALSLKVDGVANKRHYVSHLSCFVTGAATSKDVLVSITKGSGATLEYLWSGAFGSGAARGALISEHFDPPIPLPIGEDAILSAEAGGAGCAIMGSMVVLTE